MKRTLLLGGIVILASVLGAAQMMEASSSGDINTVMIASTHNYPDALVSAAPASKLGIPVLLTSRDRLSSSTANALGRFDVDSAVIVGGPSVISETVESDIEARVNTTMRLWGTTQTGTSVEVASYFWGEGSEEVMIAQYPQDTAGGYRLLAAVKAEMRDEVKEGEAPLLISKEGTLSASVLTQVEELGATKAYVYSTNAVNVTSDLEDAGVEDIEIEEAEIEQLSQRLQDRQMDSNVSRLVIVAAADFRDVIATPAASHSASFMVDSEEEISDAVEKARRTNATEIFVVGKPDLASDIADRIEEETGRTVDHVSGDAEEVAESFMNRSRDEWSELQRKRLGNWEDRVNSAPGIKNAANVTLRKAENFIDQNSSEHARNLLISAQNSYQNGHYFTARKQAMRAYSEARSSRFRQMNWEDVREEMKDERQSFRDAAMDIREINRERAQALREAESVEEKKEILKDYREKRREAREDLRKENRDSQEELDKRLRQKFEKSSGDAGSYEMELKVEGSRVEGSASYIGRSAGYTVSRSVDVKGNSVDFTFEFDSPGGPAAQVITEYEAEAERSLEDGTYKATVELVVDGSTVETLTRDITVPSFREYKVEMEQEPESERDRENMNETGDEFRDMQRERDSNQETEFELESTDNSFYMEGEQVDQLTVPKNRMVTIEFEAREEGTYYAGVEYRSDFRGFGSVGPIDPGEDTETRFNASQDFTIESYWPESNTLKTRLKVNAE